MVRIKVKNTFYACSAMDCGYVGENDAEHNRRPFHRLYRMIRNPQYTVSAHECTPRFTNIWIDNTQIINIALSTGRCNYCNKYVTVVKKEEVGR